MKVYESSTNDRKITIGNLRIINRRRRSIQQLRRIYLDSVAYFD